MRKKTLSIIKKDPWLKPYADAINGRYQSAIDKEAELTAQCGSLTDFANGHKFFGLHRTDTGWTFREWAPNASTITLIGDFNNWKPCDEFSLTRHKGGVWEGSFPAHAIKHGQLYKMLVQ